MSQVDSLVLLAVTNIVIHVQYQVIMVLSALFCALRTMYMKAHPHIRVPGRCLSIKCVDQAFNE